MTPPMGLHLLNNGKKTITECSKNLIGNNNK